MDGLLDENGNPTKQYPLPPDARDRRSEFENTIMRAYMTKQAQENGTEPPERVYQSEFDRKFHEWCDRNWERYENTRTWAETSAPRCLYAFDKTHDVMFYIGEKCADAFGLNTSRYQWVIDAAEQQAYQEQRERAEEAEAIRELEEEEEQQAAADADALEGGMQGMQLEDGSSQSESTEVVSEGLAVPKAVPEQVLQEQAVEQTVEQAVEQDVEQDVKQEVIEK